MFRLSVLCCMLVPTALTGQAARPSAPRDSQPVAITHVTVIDVEHGRRLPGQTILTEGNRITVIGAAAAVRVPPGARGIPGRGKFLVRQLGRAIGWTGSASRCRETPVATRSGALCFDSAPYAGIAPIRSKS